MKLTKLVLENFRSVRERQEIDFAPVTLLLGPNSAGKTTILIALFYLLQIYNQQFLLALLHHFYYVLSQ
ncbi:AAA family ATPase, partial [Escherichia coli]|nr:AAA family ATPase [Escherichia coli]